jgi:putative ubiquitin-RnfH superfamily antitoxin RatB of RatAB toxin-antitoxin module
MAITKLTVEVAYATPAAQRIIVLQVEEGVTLEEVIHASGILVFFPEIDLNTQKIGIFSQQKNLTDVIKEGDRVEIYRPLTMDPKEARRLRADKFQSKISKNRS